MMSGMGFDPDAELENSADSGLCAHGAEYMLKWSWVEIYASVGQRSLLL